MVHVRMIFYVRSSKKGFRKSKKNCQKYVEKLEKNGFEVQQAFIFGSYDRGNFHEASDIDVAIVSDEFGDLKTWDAKEKFLWRQIIDVYSRLLPIGLTKDSLVNDTFPLAWEVKKHGIRIK